MGLILDTSVLVAAERRRFDLDGFLSGQTETPIVISAITASELLHGLERQTDPKWKREMAGNIEDIFGKFPILPFGLAEARHHAHIWAQLSTRGQMIGNHDLLIAATSLSHDYTLATLNTAEFRRIPNLKLANTSSFALH